MDKNKNVSKTEEVKKESVVVENKPQIINLQKTKKKDIDFDKLPAGTVIVDEVRQ